MTELEELLAKAVVGLMDEGLMYYGHRVSIDLPPAMTSAIALFDNGRIPMGSIRQMIVDRPRLAATLGVK